jgi:hypothetical protein
VQPVGSGSATSSAAAVVPFQRGAPSTSKKVGQIPANYTQGSGTIVSGATAGKATEAALAAYPGGIIDRQEAGSNLPIDRRQNPLQNAAFHTVQRCGVCWRILWVSS